MSANNIKGIFPSLKKKGPVYFQSLLERDYIFLLEYSQNVLDYQIHPFQIEYPNRGRNRLAIPSFLVKRDNQEVVVECTRMAKRDTQIAAAKIEAVRRWCLEQGVDFEESIDEELRSGYLLKNIKHLHRFARYEFDLSLRRKIHTFINANGTVCIDDVIHEVCPEYPWNAYVALMNMAWNHEIQLPLDKDLIHANIDFNK